MESDYSNGRVNRPLCRRDDYRARYKRNRRVVFLPSSLPRIVFPGKWNRKSGDRERSPYVSVLRGSKGEVKLMELMFSERGVAFLGRVGHLGWIFELDGRFWQRGRVRHHSDREAYTLPSDLVPSWHPKSRRFPLVARQRGRGECTWANRLGVRKLQLIEALLLFPLPLSPSSRPIDKFSAKVRSAQKRIAVEDILDPSSSIFPRGRKKKEEREREGERISLKSCFFRTKNIDEQRRVFLRLSLFYFAIFLSHPDGSPCLDSGLFIPCTMDEIIENL